MDYQHLILRSLLSKYEENPPSKTDRGADRRTAVQLGRNSRDLPAYSLAKPTERERFHAIVRDLSNQKLITFSWEPFSHGRVLGTLWLNETPGHLAKSYALIGELPRSEVAAMIRQKIADVLADLGRQTAIGSCSDSQTGWIILALQEIATQIADKDQIAPWLPEAKAMAEALLDTMHALGQADFSEMNIQAFSVWLFHEPKFFETNIERHLLMLILRFHPRMTDFSSEQSNDEILGMVGLHRSSEILEFSGPVSLVIKGIKVDFSPFSEGSSLNARMVPLIENVETSRINRMILVEHHACYEHLLRCGAGPDELVIWHGSIYSCRKDRFLQMIAAALPAGSEILFWGDIDLGGFTHYLNLCGLLDRPVKTWRMDGSTLVSQQSLAAEISESNRDMLKKARANPFYQPVAGMLDLMLETGLHLDQTTFLPRR